MALLDVVGQQLLEVAVKDSDAGDDVAGSRCPGERFRAAVPVLDVRLDRLDEYAEGGERAAPDRLPRDDVRWCRRTPAGTLGPPRSRPPRTAPRGPAGPGAGASPPASARPWRSGSPGCRWP